MSADWYTASGVPADASDGDASLMRGEFSLISQMTEKLPNLTGNENKIIVVNAGATSLTALAPTDFLALLSGSAATFAGVSSTIDDSTNSAVTDVVTFTHTTSGTPATGIGTGASFVTETASGNHIGMKVESVSTDVGDGTEDFDLVISLMVGGTLAEAFKVTSAGVVTASGTTFATGGGTATGTNTGDQTSVTGNAGTVTTNANLTGHVTSVGNAAVLGSFTLAQLNTAISDATAAILGANTFAGTQNFADNILLRAKLKDSSEVVNAIGSTGGGTQDIDWEDGNYVSLTVDTSENTITFSNFPTSGVLGGGILEVTNGGSQTFNWPAACKFVNDTAPVLTVSGVDLLVVTSRDGGATILVSSAGLAYA